MAANSYLEINNEPNVSRINGNPTLNKMTPVWHKSVERFRSYRIYCVLASYHFMDRKMRGDKTQMQQEFKRIQSLAK
jgi:hypothetical protein